MMGSLKGLKVLIVEDEYLLASLLKDVVEDLGASVVGPFSKVEPALQQVASGQLPDVGLLDVNLGTESSFPLADELSRRGIPTALLTGYDVNALPEQYRGLAYLRKPIDLAAVHNVLENLGSRAGARTASP